MKSVEDIVNYIFKDTGIIVMSVEIVIAGVSIKVEYIPLKGFITACKFANNVEMLWTDLVFIPVANEIDRVINDFNQTKLLVNEYIVGTIDIERCKKELTEGIVDTMNLVVEKHLQLK
jgi:hypothetical protein